MAELERILTEGVTSEELAQAQIAWETEFVLRLQEMGGFGGKADALQRGRLPTHIVSAPRPELLYLQPAFAFATDKEVEFDDV